MRRLGTLLKWAAIALVAAEWYARVGREFVFGEDVQEWGVGPTIRHWVPLPQDWPPPTRGVPGPIRNSDGDEIGMIHQVRVGESRDLAGHEISRVEVLSEVLSDKVGRPINVALSEIEMLTRDALTAARDAT